jgi:hypothetical protein
VVAIEDGDGDDDWNTWRRKEAETYGQGCPADVTQYSETMVPGTCFSSRRAMFDAIRVRSSSSVSRDEGFVPCDPGVIPG